MFTYNKNSTLCKILMFTTEWFTYMKKIKRMSGFKKTALEKRYYFIIMHSHYRTIIRLF